MQRRYCACGYPIWVQYLFTEIDCETIFWTKSEKKGSRLTLCPCCRQRLNIDELR